MSQSVSEITALWSRVLVRLKSDLNDENIYDSFLADSYIDSIDGRKMIVAVNSGVAAFVLSNKYYELVKTAVNSTSGTDFDVEFQVAGSIQHDVKAKTPVKTFFSDCPKLNPNYNFGSFVVGDSNKEALQASLFVSRQLAGLYNPLFIYSDSGLGKTHLLHAIGNFARENNPSLKVLYISASNFVDEFVNAVTVDTDARALKNFFKSSVDVLLLDDIQWMAKKKATTDFFFDIFNDFISNGKQIVMTSDQLPSNIDGLPERLKTRFMSGLTLSIKAPDVTTSINILKAKIEANGLDPQNFDEDALAFYAEKFSTSVRELEGALIKLFYYTVNIKPCSHVDLQTAQEAVSDLTKSRGDSSKLSEKRIIAVVADYYNLTASQLTGKIRTSQIAMARHIAMYLCRFLLDSPFEKIGDAFGGRDHSSVMNGVQKVDRTLKSDEALKTAVKTLKERLKNN